MFNIPRCKRLYPSNIITVTILFFIMGLGCSNAQEKPNKQNLLVAVEQAAEVAVSNKDFRLYATSGRRITFPGVDNSDYRFVEEVCGKKHFSNTGDVISSEEQREQRKNNINYMKMYNQKVLKECRNQ